MPAVDPEKVVLREVPVAAILGGHRWLPLDKEVAAAELRETTKIKSLSAESLPEVSDPYGQLEHPPEAFQIIREGDLSISKPVAIKDLASSIEETHKDTKNRTIIFLPITQELKDFILDVPYQTSPTSGILPETITKVTNKLGIGEERFMQVVRLTPTAGYESEVNKFFSFCIPEHSYTGLKLEELKSAKDITDMPILQTNLMQLIFNDRYTLVVYDPSSAKSNKLKEDLKTGEIAYFKPKDCLPVITTLVKDIVEKNKDAVNRVGTLFHRFKNTHVTFINVRPFSSFSMAMTEIQNYWENEDSPKSQMRFLLSTIKKYTENLPDNLFQEDKYFEELLATCRQTTGRAKEFSRAMDIRDAVREKIVSTHSAALSHAITTFGAGVGPNAVALAIPLQDIPKIGLGLSLIAHTLATITSATILYRLYKADWFEFVTDVLPFRRSRKD